MENYFLPSPNTHTLCVRVNHPEKTDYPIDTTFSKNSFEPRQILLQDPFLKKLKTFLDSYNVKYVCCYEMPDDQVARPHTHTVIELPAMPTSQKTIDKFRKQFRAKFPECEKNGGYAMKQAGPTEKNKLQNIDGANQYACKGPFHGELYLIGSRDANVEVYHEAYWKIMESKDVTDKEKQTQLKQEKVRKTPWMEEVIKEYQMTTIPSQITKRSVFEFCVTKLGKAFKPLDEMIVRRLVLGVYSAVIDGPRKEEFRETLYDKCFGEF
jgi:hypothetical protein